MNDATFNAIHRSPSARASKPSCTPSSFRLVLVLALNLLFCTSHSGCTQKQPTPPTGSSINCVERQVASQFDYPPPGAVWADDCGTMVYGIYDGDFDQTSLHKYNCVSGTDSVFLTMPNEYVFVWDAKVNSARFLTSYDPSSGSSSARQVREFDTTGQLLRTFSTPSGYSDAFARYMPSQDSIAFARTDTTTQTTIILLRSTDSETSAPRILWEPQSHQIEVKSLSWWGDSIVVVSHERNPGDACTPDIDPCAALIRTTHADSCELCFFGRGIRELEMHPSGRFLAFVPESGDLNVFIVDKDGVGKTQITDDVAGEVDLRWTPDGRYLSYFRHKNATFIWSLTIKAIPELRP